MDALEFKYQYPANVLDKIQTAHTREMLWFTLVLSESNIGNFFKCSNKKPPK